MSLRDVPPELSEMQLLEQLSFERHLLNESAKLQAQLKTEAFAAKHLAAMDDEAEAKKNRQKADSAEHALRARRADEYAAALEEANHKAIEERRRMCINRAEDEAQQLAEAHAAAASTMEKNKRAKEEARQQAAAVRKERTDRQRAAEVARLEESQRKGEAKAEAAAAQMERAAAALASRAAARAEVAQEKMQQVVRRRSDELAEQRRMAEAHQALKEARVEARRAESERRIEQLQELQRERRAQLQESRREQARREEAQRQQLQSQLDEKEERARCHAEVRRAQAEERARRKGEAAERGRLRVQRTAQQIERSLAELEEALEQRGEQAEQFRQRQLDLIDTRRQMAMEASQERHRLSTNMQLALTQPARADLGSLDVALPPHLAASMPVTDQARSLLEVVAPSESGCLSPSRTLPRLQAESAPYLPTVFGPHEPASPATSPTKRSGLRPPPPPTRSPRTDSVYGAGRGALPTPTQQRQAAAEQARQQREQWARRHIWEHTSQRGYNLDYYAPLLSMSPTAPDPAYTRAWTPPSSSPVARGLQQPGFRRGSPYQWITQPDSPPLTVRASQSLPMLRGVRHHYN